MNRVNKRARGAAFDHSGSFGWISIALHWTTAALIIALWVIGKKISVLPDGSPDAWRSLHVTIGFSAWFLLAARIAWRFYSAHPHSEGVSLRTHEIAKAAHYVMLASLTLLILSGLLVAWLGTGNRVGSVAFSVHLNAGNVLLVLVITHTLAAVKHLMFHHDDSVVRMLWPKPQDKNT